MFRLVQNKKSKPNFVGFCRYGANVGLMVCLALVRLGLSQVCAQTPDDGEFLSQIRDAINEASAVRVFKLERPLSADDPELTARDIPPALIERAFDRYDFRLGSL